MITFTRVYHAQAELQSIMSIDINKKLLKKIGSPTIDLGLQIYIFHQNSNRYGKSV